jgi:hypothetical protein
MFGGMDLGNAAGNTTGAPASKPAAGKPKKAGGLFVEDEDEDDGGDIFAADPLAKPKAEPEAAPAPVKKKPAVSLFGLDDDDDDFLGGAGDDLFGDLGKPPKAMAGAEGSAAAAAGASGPASKPAKSLFADDEEDDLFTDAAEPSSEPQAASAADDDDEIPAKQAAPEEKVRCPHGWVGMVS